MEEELARLPNRTNSPPDNRFDSFIAEPTLFCGIRGAARTQSRLESRTGPARNHRRRSLMTFARLCLVIRLAQFEQLVERRQTARNGVAAKSRFEVP